MSADGGFRGVRRAGFAGSPVGPQALPMNLHKVGTARRAVRRGSGRLGPPSLRSGEASEASLPTLAMAAPRDSRCVAVSEGGGAIWDFGRSGRFPGLQWMAETRMTKLFATCL